MHIRQRRSSIVVAGAALVLMVTGCGDSPEPDAPVELEKRTTVETPLNRNEVPQADIPQDQDPGLTDTVPGAEPGPVGESPVPDANAPNSSSTVPRGGLPPG
jgi:hypothetical protein